MRQFSKKVIKVFGETETVIRIKDVAPQNMIQLPRTSLKAVKSDMHFPTSVSAADLEFQS